MTWVIYDTKNTIDSGYTISLIIADSHFHLSVYYLSHIQGRVHYEPKLIGIFFMKPIVGKSVVNQHSIQKS